MLKLSIARTDLGTPVLPDLTDPSVQVWHENNGTVCAYGYTASGQHWMHFPGLGSYCFSSHSDEVIAFAEPSARLDWLRDTFYRSVLPMALQVFGKEALHASAVETAYGDDRILCDFRVRQINHRLRFEPAWPSFVGG